MFLDVIKIGQSRIEYKTYLMCPNCGNKKHFHLEEVSNGWEYPPDHYLICSRCPTWDDPVDVSYSKWSGTYFKLRFRKNKNGY